MNMNMNMNVNMNMNMNTNTHMNTIRLGQSGRERAGSGGTTAHHHMVKRARTAPHPPGRLYAV
jgi:hypothetical protein